MDTDQAKRKAQREFLFVFRSQARSDVHRADDADANTIRSPLSNNEEAKAVRKQLISELKKFGC